MPSKTNVNTRSAAQFCEISFAILNKVMPSTKLKQKNWYPETFRRKGMQLFDPYYRCWCSSTCRHSDECSRVKRTLLSTHFAQHWINTFLAEYALLLNECQCVHSWNAICYKSPLIWHAFVCGGGDKCAKWNYRKTSNIRRILEGDKFLDHSDVVGASPVGAAPTTSSFST